MWKNVKHDHAMWARLSNGIEKAINPSPMATGDRLWFLPGFGPQLHPSISGDAQ